MIPYNLVDTLVKYWTARDSSLDCRLPTGVTAVSDAYIAAVKDEVLTSMVGAPAFYPAGYDPDTFDPTPANLDAFRAQTTQDVNRRPEALPQFRLQDPWTVRDPGTRLLWPAQTDDYVPPDALSLDGSTYQAHVWLLEPLCLAYEAMLARRGATDVLSEGASGVLGRILRDMVFVGMKNRYTSAADPAMSKGFVTDGVVLPPDLDWLATSLWALLYWEVPSETHDLLDQLEDQVSGWMNRGLPSDSYRWSFGQASALLCLHGRTDWRPVAEAQVRILLDKKCWRVYGQNLYIPDDYLKAPDDCATIRQAGRAVRMLHFAARASIPGASEALRWIGRHFWKHLTVQDEQHPNRVAATIGGGWSYPALSSSDSSGWLLSLPESWAEDYHKSYMIGKAGLASQEPYTTRHFETTWIGMLYHEAHSLWTAYKALHRFAPFLQ